MEKKKPLSKKLGKNKKYDMNRRIKKLKIEVSKLNNDGNIYNNLLNIPETPDLDRFILFISFSVILHIQIINLLPVSFPGQLHTQIAFYFPLCEAVTLHDFPKNERKLHKH